MENAPEQADPGLETAIDAVSDRRLMRLLPDHRREYPPDRRREYPPDRRRTCPAAARDSPPW